MVTVIRRTLCGLAAGAVLVHLSCGSPPPARTVAPPDKVVLVTPETGPSERQQALAALAPAPTRSSSRAEKRLSKALGAYHKRLRSHRAHIAVDKPLYQPGETIWFRTFDLLSADLTGESEEYGTRFELISPKGAVVLEKLARTAAGAATNDFVLPAHVPGGEYIIKATTQRGLEVERAVIVSSYQPPRIKKKLEFVRKAYGPGDSVSAALSLSRATGEPLGGHALTGLVVLDGAELARVPTTTDAAGNAIIRFDLPGTIQRGDGLLTALIEDGGVTESIQKRIPITLDKLQFTAYPEGGELIAGLPGRIYFSAKNLLDKPADVEGRVVDDQGRVAALLRSYYNGMGRFELTPQPGRSYTVKLDKPAGISQEFAIPAARDAGCSLQMVDDIHSRDENIRVAVWCTHARTVIASAVLRDRLLGTSTVSVGAGIPAIVALRAPTTAQGAVRVTLFDDDLQPMAERLVYRNRQKDLDIQLTADRPTYNPRDRVTLTVETKGLDGKPVAADLALSVVDDTVLSFADDKTAHLLARLYLESEMPGQKIEEPNLYFSDDPKAPAGLDLVLGTQGWRRFDWQPVFAPPEPDPIEEDWSFTGNYWQDEDGLPDPEPEAELKDAEKKADEAEGRQGQKGEGKARQPPAGKQLEVDGRIADVPEAKPAMKRQVMFDVAAAEAIVVAGEIDRGGFGIGGEEQRRKWRIRDRDWGDANDRGKRAWNYAPVRVFPVPNYQARYDGPRVDFRETVYWQPQVRTDASGRAQVQFYLSDAVTSFRASAEGFGAGVIGRGETLIQSKLPVSLAVTMPLEVSAGDLIRLPVTVANETDQPYAARLDAAFGDAFALEIPPVGAGESGHLSLAAGERKSFFYGLRVVGARKSDGTARATDARITVEAAKLRDQVERKIRVVPLGFPQEFSAAGTLADRVSHKLMLPKSLATNTLSAEITLYPSPLATMQEGTESIIREPTGCFEQASSANYPNIMILTYMEQHGAADPALIERTNGLLERGYRKLVGYESPKKGYEWFGGDPGHEALTAYGLMEFKDMVAVYDDVDTGMIERTAEWLKKRRDGEGGYQRNDRALDSFGRASAEVTDAYITYALTEASASDIAKEIARQAQMAEKTSDPYVLALASNSLMNSDATSGQARKAVKKLSTLQADDGSFAGADHSITRSGGVALNIESTALAALALMKAGDRYMANVRTAIEWLNKNRDGFGGYGSTQSTVLALKAMSGYAAYSRRTRASGVVKVMLRGDQIGELVYDKGHQGALHFDLGPFLRAGENNVELRIDSEEPIPYSILATYRSSVPASSPDTKVRVATKLTRASVPMGENVRLDVRVENRTDKGLPMTLARVGIPGGLTYQTWQLKELRDKKLIDFYETREREVILYFRSLPGKAIKDVAIELLARVPGDYTAPASRAYLYYTDEYKHWIAPERVTVSK